ncbi:MAG: hypothetical protein JOZ54_22735 [Acidobacteria bacterium]|nr:hypothetical protein [Acidobacteriota bacterium]
MKNYKAIAVKLSTVSSLALLLTTSAFADSRPQNQTFQLAANHNYQTIRYRENQRLTVQGKVTSFNRENGGYRLRIDRDDSSFWVPDSYFRNHTNDLRVGVSLSLGGVFRGGSVYVDAVNWPNGYGYNDGYNNGNRGGVRNDVLLRGVVDRVDFRSATVWVRDNASRRIIEVDMRGERRGRININDLRRGDRVDITGDWTRSGLFIANRIESVRGR